MPAYAAAAPGKVILFGEHAVVYGRPAIAAPVTQVRARALVTANPGAPAGTVRIVARDIRLECDLIRLPQDHPLALAVRETAARVGVKQIPSCTVQITSTIPIASGMGSGAAVSVAIARAVSAFLGSPLEEADVNAVAYRVDQRHHGTPSGIDNTVITYSQPVWYVRGQPFERLTVGAPFTIVIGDTGVRSPTGEVVGNLRARAQADPAQYEPLFDSIGEIAREARRCIETGDTVALGALMRSNHALLQSLDVSSAALDRLVEAALAAGAGGAKLCGAGRGGNMIALSPPEQADAVAQALKTAGAVHAIVTTIQ